MANEKETNRNLLPIERFKHFKGIYLTETRQYFLCDFYEVLHPDSTITYRVKADDNKLTTFETEIYQEHGKYKVTNTSLPIDLQLQLIDIIDNTFDMGNSTLEEPLPIQESKTSLIKGMKSYLLLKFGTARQNKKGIIGILPLIIIAIMIGTALTSYCIYAQLNADQIIIPYGYTGNVTIIYGQANGEPAVENEETRLFNIPANGLLSTQSEYLRSKATQFYYRMPDSSLYQLYQVHISGPGRTTGMLQKDTFTIGDMKVSQTELNGSKSMAATFMVKKNS